MEEMTTSNTIPREKSRPKQTPGIGVDTGGVLPKSPFVTTSDVINQLNKHLSDLSTVDGDGDEGLDSGEQSQGCFELQKRLPNGSAIPATPDEAAAADFKTKLDQTIKLVSQLESRQDRQDWAEQQRRTGNEFFHQGDYKSAMDIYLTCLVVKENTPDFVRDTLLPVFNNLAQCTLQLGMHKKTIVFCETALVELSKAKKNASDTENESNQKQGNGNEASGEDNSAFDERDRGDSIALCKIYFKLGKALRLTGHYKEAREALKNSFSCLIEKESKVPIPRPSSGDDGAKTSSSFAPYRKAIDKEFRCLEIAEREAKRNRVRQKRAMQTILSRTPTSESSPPLSQGSSGDEMGPLSTKPLYEESESRQFSRLRVRKAPSTFQHQTKSDSPIQYYGQYYWTLVARVAKALLVMLGDEEDIDMEESSNDGPEKMNASKKRL